MTVTGGAPKRRGKAKKKPASKKRTTKKTTTKRKTTKRKTTKKAGRSKKTMAELQKEAKSMGVSLSGRSGRRTREQLRDAIAYQKRK